MAKIRDIAGMRFGDLRAIEPTERRCGHSVVWRCECLRCGRECFVSCADLVSGNTKSCGCLRAQGHAKDITDRRFGSLIARRPTGDVRHGSRVWECVCDCGNVHFTTVRELTQGSTTSCGCYRDKQHAARLLKKRFPTLEDALDFVRDIYLENGDQGGRQDPPGLA